MNGPNDDKRVIHIEQYLNSYADDLMHDFLYNEDNEEYIEKCIVESPAYDEFLMQLPFNTIGTIELFKETHLQDYESIIELSDKYQSYCDRRAMDNWIEYCEYKRGMSYREEV